MLGRGQVSRQLRLLRETNLIMPPFCNHACLKFIAIAPGVRLTCSVGLIRLLWVSALFSVVAVHYYYIQWAPSLRPMRARSSSIRSIQGRRLRASGRLQEADEVDNEVVAIESREEHQWRTRVEVTTPTAARLMKKNVW